jgi:hypothetical protein
MPASDFAELAIAINAIYGEDYCSVKDKMTCYIPKPCSQIPEIPNGYLRILLAGSGGKTF